MTRTHRTNYSPGTLLVTDRKVPDDSKGKRDKVEREEERRKRLLKFLKYVAENPGEVFTRVLQGLRWSQTIGEDIQDILERNGFIEKRRRKEHSRGSFSPRYLYLTEKGKAALGEDPEAKGALLKSR